MTEKKKILIVDDEELNLLLLKDMLKMLNYEAIPAETGSDALEKMSLAVDMVLMDVMMPDMDGFEAIRKIRERPEYNDIPIIMVTALNSVQDRLRAVESGANDFINKPVDFAELKVRVNSLLKIKENRDAIRDYQAQLEEMVKTQKKLTGAIEHSADHIIITNRDAVIEYVNPSVETDTGYKQDELIGQNPSLLKSGRHDNAFYEHFWKTILSGNTYRGIMINRKKTREIYFNEVSVTPIRDRQGEITHFAYSGRDITKVKLRDEITGLPSKPLFLEYIENALTRTAPGGENLFHVILLDIDNFNVINNTYGFAVGDQFLREFARRLEESLGPDDRAAHLNGDEFGLLLESSRDIGYAVSMAESINESLKKPIVVSGQEIIAGACMGLLQCGPDSRSREDILRDADVALNRAKQRGKSSYEVYDPAMLATIAERFKTELKLRKAIKQEEFVLHFQPIVSLRERRVVSVEALIRWNDPETGMVPPVKFISIAEDSGLIIPMGEWIIKRACAHMVECGEKTGLDIQVAVNLSAQQFEAGNLYEIIVAALQETGLPPRSLKLEITESTVAREPEKAIETLSKLKSLGVVVLIDDFGTGYSNLSYLKRFPIDILKIDRSFIIDIPNDPDSVAIALTIIAMARSLNLEVLAEGVETREQLKFLKEHGCDLIQGYLFSRPLPPDQCVDFLIKGKLDCLS